MVSSFNLKAILTLPDLLSPFSATMCSPNLKAHSTLSLYLSLERVRAERNVQRKSVVYLHSTVIPSLKPKCLHFAFQVCLNCYTISNKIEEKKSVLQLTLLPKQ